MSLYKRIDKTTNLLFLLASSGIFYILLNKKHFEFTQQVSYAQLYPSYDSIQIRAFKQVNDSTIQVKTFNQYSSTQQWLIYVDNNAEPIKNAGNYPSVPLQKGTHTYKIQKKTSDEGIEIEAEYIPKGKWDDKNFTESNITILRSNLPSKDNFADLKKWQEYPVILSEKEKQLIASILKDSVQINTNDSISKGEKISRYLCSRISANNGHMNDSIRKLSVCSQYTSTLNGAKIDCGVYSNIFAMFAQEAGVVNRIVELKHNFGTFNSNIHIFNEYFDEKRNSWVATDIMLNNVNYKTTDGSLLNGVQVKNHLNGSMLSVTQAIPFTDSMQTSSIDSLNPAFYNYYSIDKDLYYYYDFNSQEVYSFKQKLNRFFFKNPWYGVYSDTTIFSNRLFYLKQFLFVGWIILFAIMLLSALLKKRS